MFIYIHKALLLSTSMNPVNFYMQRLQTIIFKHKTAKACPPEQCGVPLHLRGHFKKWRGTAVCSLLMIVILLFNLLFRSMSSFRGVRRTAVQMPS